MTADAKISEWQRSKASTILADAADRRGWSKMQNESKKAQRIFPRTQRVQAV
jgi:hypothetical protein